MLTMCYSKIYLRNTIYYLTKDRVYVCSPLYIEFLFLAFLKNRKLSVLRGYYIQRKSNLKHTAYKKLIFPD